MTTLLLIRHGANDWVHGRLAGRLAGVHLNDEGRRQAAAVAARLAELPLDAIYSSPLDRTVETAQAIAGPRGLPLRLLEAIQEVDYGEWQGAELKELYKHELWPGVQHYPSGTRFPNGETLGETQMRIVTALDGLRARHPKGIVAVVSHADAIRLAIAYYIGIHIDLFQRLEIGPCSVTALSFGRMGPRMLAYNDLGSLAHLKPRPEPPAEAKAEAPAAHGEPATAAAEVEQAQPAGDQADGAAPHVEGSDSAPAAPQANGVEGSAERMSASG